ncbi:glycosyltransferase family 2 protein [Paenibacillus tarimensis]
MNPKVSVVIVAHNRWSYISQCLDSLQRNTDYPCMEIVVVDNASTDETKERLSACRQQNVKPVVLHENAGFAAGVSAGCRAALGDILILLNNDTIVPPGWIFRLLRPLLEHTDIGMAGPMTNVADDGQTVDFFIGDSVRGADRRWLNDFYLFNKGSFRYTDFLAFFCVAGSL